MELKKLVKSGEGENYDYSQDHCFIKVSSKDTNGELCFVEDTLKPGFHLKRHQHKIMTEVFYMLEGEMELIFDDETIILKPGDTITVPPNVWHEAKCVKGGKMLSIFKDGQFDIFLEELSKMNDAQFADKEFMDAFSAKFDIYEQEL
ncbi:cupin domain-containing protein [Flammeovirga kamogawensis]|uniref:Cupin domain-containing protein n=1 Tax=Flammeovirga kamogawensis TaxID=373891 RepID=A0ABX8H4C9_9BACT|nr:cupin domain-containing protein [Flammeovirga kamogawensis]MBB6461939.1 quercetin dioxygenase-like cupin family protein [Flammeovirga kamogawensis]QWG10454.1 cupin domain-containing protein [Flammeovirga kamogawensis]TRX63565.1 cupin domain-containing protein [Flammeovirga kamogawensis]